jgi:predicted DNA-binding ribbon-helix-helix protein
LTGASPAGFSGGGSANAKEQDMCQIFVRANPQSYEATTRSIRLHGVVTSVRLENLFWETLEEIGLRDGMSVPQLLSKLYDELLEHRGDIPNFSSFLRVCGLRYRALQVDQRIPIDLSIPIRSLSPHAVLRGLRSSLVDVGVA